MKVICLTESISRLGGGLFDAERRLQQTAAGLDAELETTVIGMRDRHSNDDFRLWQPLAAETVNTSGFPGSLGYSKEFLIRLNQVSPDVVYSIGLWKYFSRSCLQWHEQTNRPYLVAPHGMLDEWAMKNHWFRKRVLLAWYQRRHLQNAACIRALNESEARSIRNLGLSNPICVIPNGVDVPLESIKRATLGDGVNRLLFLGRIHPKKGLHVLLDAWRQVSSRRGEWRLQIAGWGDDNHVSQLIAQIEELGLSKSVEFLGPLFDEAKATAFREATAFILPSFSEGMPMTILEAWSYGLPVVMTPFCNIPAGEQNEACFMCQPELNSVAEALTRLFGTTEQDRIAMGERGKKLVQSQFTWEKVASNMVDVYHWLAEGTEAPDSVCFD